MDKNIVAIVREDTRSINVMFESGRQQYTYITTLTDIVVGDTVVVPVRDSKSEDFSAVVFKTAKVVAVHDDLEIEPNAEYAYRWVVAKVDFIQYNKVLAENAVLADRIHKEYRRHAREQLKQLVMGDMDVQQLLKGQE